MRIYITIMYMLCCPFIGFSQSDKTIDFSANFDYTHRVLVTTAQDSMTQNLLANRNELETGKTNWRIGINYSRSLSDNIIFKVGIGLSSVGFKGQNLTGLKYPSEHDGAGNWTPDPTLAHEYQLIYDYLFFEIPISGRYMFGDGKLQPYVEVGVSIGSYLGTRLTARTDIGSDSTFENEYEVNQFAAIGTLAVGLNYKINDQYQFYGQPTFRYYNSEIQDMFIAGNLNSLGLEMGIRKSL